MCGSLILYNRFVKYASPNFRFLPNRHIFLHALLRTHTKTSQKPAKDVTSSYLGLSLLSLLSLLYSQLRVFSWDYAAAFEHMPAIHGRRSVRCFCRYAGNMKLSVSILLAVDFKNDRFKFKYMRILAACSFGVLYAGNLIVFITILYFTAVKIFLDSLDVFKRIFHW